MVRRGKKKGFTLIEVLIDAFLITAIFGAIVGSFIVSLRAVNSGKVNSAAALLASEQIERLRNLPYTELATQNGTVLPQGNIPDSQTVNRAGNNYDLLTSVITIDDSSDGCAIPSGTTYQCTDGSLSNTFDTVPTDYKRITVKVFNSGSSTLLSTNTTDVAASAAETAGSTGMLLAIISDADGLAVEGATVSITNSLTGVTIQALSNTLGQVFVANLPPDNQNGYHLVATKNGYSTDSTTDRTAQNPNQVQPDVDVSVQQVTTQTLRIDLLSTLTLALLDTQSQPLANINVTLTSSKITATNPDTPKNVYTQLTDGSGNITYTNVEWDSYAITLPNGYYIASTSPYQLVSLAPGVTEPVVLTATTSNSFPRITSIAPTSAIIGNVVTLDIEGYNFTSNSTVILELAGTQIIASQTDVAPNGKSIAVTFNLTTATAGDWDVVINSNGSIVKQIKGLVVSPWKKALL